HQDTMGCGASTTMGRGASTIRTTATRVAKKEAISAAKAVGSDIVAQIKEAEAESSASQQVKTELVAPQQEQEEACIRALNLLEGVASGDEASLADLDKEVDLALSTVSKLLDDPQGAVDLQALKLPNRSSAERKLAQLSVLGQVVVDLAAASVAALPFGAPVAAAIGGIYARATQAAKNSANCARLLALVQQCDRQLAKLMCGVKRQQGGHKVPAEARQGLRTMAELLVKASHVMASYSGRGFLMRAVTSTSDKATFASLEAQIRAAMQVCGAGATDTGAGSLASIRLVPHLCRALACRLQGACFAMTVELVITQGPYADEWAAFRAAVCKAAGLPDSKVQHALLQLQSFQPAVLRSIQEQHCGLPDRVMAVELSDIKAGMVQLGSELAKLHQSQDKAAARGPAALPKYLQTWWFNSVGELETQVANTTFVTQLINWFSQAGAGFLVKALLQARLAAYDQKLRTEGKLPLLPHQQHVFLHYVIVPLADVDKDGFVTRSELLRLQQLGECYAEQALVDAPESLPQLLSAVFLGHDRDMLAKELVMQGADVMATVREKLQVAEVIRGYRIAQLLDEYHSGSRQWMYTRVNDWLNASSSSSPGGEATASRLFLLLADAGMGKSVFSAVMHTKLVVRGNKDSGLVMAHHFFTVGQARSQGRTMLLCLAQQLAEKLPGLAELLLPVVEQHGNASQLSLQDTFTRFLRLPVWVRVLLTGRPQVEAAFAAWKPEWIKPGDKQNQADLLDLLQWRLGQAQLVADSDLDAAAQLMLRKSSGQFIYTKYAFDDLSEQATWTLHEMEARLPSGLEGMYRRVLSTLEEALQTERPDLLELLRTRLLPVLVACLEPLTVQELAWATGCEADTGKVQQLVGLLANLFPCRAGGSDQQERVAPYHKSVLDWLTSAAGMSAGQFHVSTQQGHRLLASACLQQATQCVVDSQPGSSKTCTDDVPGPKLRYTLRHAVAHACLSGEAEVLQTLLLEFGFWQAAYTAGTEACQPVPAQVMGLMC
ncbi:WD_REPEATS_REGION domain-containing protein, partial [Haematococcus lacustris]